MKRLLVALCVIAGCGGSGSGGGPGNPGPGDDPIPGPETLKATLKCSSVLPSVDDLGDPDPVRGFHVSLISFLYSNGSSATTMTSEYTFRLGLAPYTTVTSKLSDGVSNTVQIENDLLVALINTEHKSGIVYKKYDLGGSSDLVCEGE